MKCKFSKISIGPRTIKTAIAVILSLVVTEILGTSDSKMIFAMLGAMAAVQPTYRESMAACCSEIIGAVFGALCSIFLCALPLPSIMSIGIGIVLVITLYNILQIRYSPSLACFILVLACTTPDIQPVSYAAGRIWDTTIGLSIGMGINLLVLPYDNSKQIRATAYSLDKIVLPFLKDFFDGENTLSDIQQMRKGIQTLEKQFDLFSNQKLLLHLRRQSQEITLFMDCEARAQALITHMEALCSLKTPGRLNEDNRQFLNDYNIIVLDQRPIWPVTEQDIVTNYHVAQILVLHRELLDVLELAKG